MNRRTPQEIADFFGSYVASDRNGQWFMFKVKPDINKAQGWWTAGKEEEESMLSHRMVIVPSNHDWTHLYEPHSDNKSESSYADQADSDNKPDHLGEVYSEREYTVIDAGHPYGVIGIVNDYMSKGWKPVGGIAVEHLPIADGYINDSAHFYQAMVRGV